MAKKKKVSWQYVMNTVSDRMIDSSLMHQLVPSRKILRRTKALNDVLQRHNTLKNYHQYVKIKTSVLRNISDDSETEDEMCLADDDYSSIFECDVTLQGYVDKLARQHKDLPLEEIIEDNSHKWKKYVGTKKLVMQQPCSSRKRRADASINIGWQQVVNKRKKASPIKSKKTVSELLDFKDLPSIAVLQEATSPSGLLVSPDKESVNYDADKESSESKAQDLQLKEMEDSEEELNDNTTLRRTSMISDKQLEAETNVSSGKKNKCESQEKENNNQQSGQLQRSKDKVKKNLASVLQTFNPFLNSGYTLRNISKTQDGQNNDTSELRFSSLHPIDQSTPLPTKKKNKCKFSKETICTTGNPKDSGIDDDSQEEYSGDGNPPSKNSEDRVKSPKKQDDETLKIKKVVEDSPCNASSSQSDCTEQIALPADPESTNTSEEETIKYSEIFADCSPSYSPQSSPSKQLKAFSVNDEQDKEDKQKLPLKVMCMEIVNKRYKIVPERQCEEETEDQEKCVDEKEVSCVNSTKSDNDCTVLVEDHGSVEETENISDGGEDNEDEYNMSALSKKRLQQLKRLNLIVDSDFSSSEDEAYNARKTIIESAPKSIEKDRDRDLSVKMTPAKGNKKRKISTFTSLKENDEGVNKRANSSGTETDKVSKNNINSQCDEDQKNANDVKKIVEELVHTNTDQNEGKNLPEKKKGATDSEECKKAKSIFSEEDDEEVNERANSCGTENDKVSKNNFNSQCDEDQENVNDVKKTLEEHVHTNIGQNEDKDLPEKKKGVRSSKERKKEKSIFSEEDDEGVDERANSCGTENDKVSTNNFNSQRDEDQKNVNDNGKVSEEPVSINIEQNENMDLLEKKKVARGSKQRKISRSMYSEDDSDDNDCHTNSGGTENGAEIFKSNFNSPCKGTQKNVNDSGKISEPKQIDHKNKSSQSKITSSHEKGTQIEEPCSPTSKIGTSKRIRTTSGLFNITLDKSNSSLKDASPEKIRKGYSKDKSITESASKLKTIDATTLPRGRPIDLQELIDEQELTENTDAASFTLTDLSDEDVYILDIPSAVFKIDLRGKRLILKKKRLKLGNERYKISRREVEPVTFVMSTGESKSAYKAVNITPTGSIIVRERLQQYFSKDILDESSNGESAACQSVVKDLATFEEQEFKIDDDEDEQVHKKEKRKTKNKRNSSRRGIVEIDSSSASDMCTPKKRKIELLKSLDTDSYGGTPKRLKSEFHKNNSNSVIGILERKRSGSNKDYDLESCLVTHKIKKSKPPEYCDADLSKKDFQEKRLKSLRHFDTDSE